MLSVPHISGSLEAALSFSLSFSLYFTYENLNASEMSQKYCSEEDCYMFGKAVASFHKSRFIHPTCYTHGKLTEMRMVT